MITNLLNTYKAQLKLADKQASPSDFFTLNLAQLDNSLDITMHMKVTLFKTNQLPATYYILKNLLPGIFKHKCFNYGKHSFAKEVVNTELGHLFEHILLEYLCRIHMREGITDFCLKGNTNWDWQNERKGTFHITVNSGFTNLKILQEALQRSIELMTIICNSIYFQQSTDYSGADDSISQLSKSLQ
jgi:hypothetical protein